MELTFSIPYDSRFLIDWNNSAILVRRGADILVSIPVDGISLEVIYSVRVLDMVSASWFTLNFWDTGIVSLDTGDEGSLEILAWLERMESSYESS